MGTQSVTNKIKNASESTALTVSYYLYQLVSQLTDFSSHEEIQYLYCSLVHRLNLENHADAVMNAIIKKKVQAGKLHLIANNPRYRQPFNCKSPLKLNFKEDRMIYEMCGQWETCDNLSIDIVRVTFGDGKYGFPELVAATFFLDPQTFEKNGYELPSKIPVSSKVKKACNDISEVQYTAESLKLTKEESRLLNAAIILHSYKEVYSLCNDFFRNDDYDRFTMYARCLDASPKDIRMLIRGDSKIKSFGLIDYDGDMDEDAVDAINAKDINLYFSDIIKKDKKSKTYSLDSFNVSKEKTDLALQFLRSKNPCNILLYGAPGSGKTQFAKALVEAAGLSADVYKNEMEVTEKRNESNATHRAISRLSCYLSLKKDNSILVVDEAENVLKTVSYGFFGMNSLPQKGTVNKFLEESENKVIWVVNYTSEMDESTLRRFTYSIKFNPMPKDTLRTIAEGKLKSLKVPSGLKQKILDLCGTYKITGASIENVARAIKSLEYKKGDDEKILKEVKSLLEANSSLLYGKKKCRDKVKDSYNLSVLNTTIPAPELVEMLENALAYKQENPDKDEGVRMLFHGLSGTGKTELARYLSQKLEKPLLKKQCSDLMSKYVGETEQNIADAFAEAEETDSILLIDEADTFFANREKANYSWERTQVNQFLQELDDFTGICIFTTNLRKIIDVAMLRRFHIITEFKALEEEGIRTLLGTYFGSYEFNDQQIESLTRTETVTPGDFATLSSGKLRFVAKDKITSEYIVQELREIQREKRLNGGLGRLGFAS